MSRLGWAPDVIAVRRRISLRLYSHRRLAVAGASSVAAATLAYEAVAPRGYVLLAALIATACVAVVLRLWGRGAWYGLLLLGAVNALPGPNLHPGGDAETLTGRVTIVLIASLIVDQ